MTYSPASLGRRLGAFAIDLIGYVVIAALLVVAPAVIANVAGLDTGLAVTIVAVGAGLWVVASVAYALYLARGKGGDGTPGMRALGLRLVDIDDGQPIGFARALLRGIVQAAAGAILVGHLSPLFDRRRRAWHDKAVAAIVVDPAAPAPDAPPEQPRESRAEASDEVEAIGAVPEFERLEPVLSADAPAPVEAIAPMPAGTGDVAYPTFETGAPVAVTPASPPPAPVQPVDVGLSEEDMATRVSPGRLRVTLTWDDGTTTPVSALTVVGRNPSVGDLDGALAVAVPDTTRSLSKTHFAIGLDSGPYIVDRHSTNGTTIVHADGAGLSLAAGVREPLRTGDTVVIGDRTFTIEVTT